MTKKLAANEKKRAEAKRASKRRARGEGSIYWAESDQQFRGSITVNRPGAKIKRKSVRGDTIFEVEEKLARALADKKKGRRSSSNLTLGKWMDEWLDRASQNPRTKATNRSQIECYVKPSIGGRRIDELDADDVYEMRRFMKSHRKANGQPLSDSIVREAHLTVRTALNVAVRERRVQFNPFRDVEPVPKPRTDRVSFTADEQERFFDAIKGRPDEGRWLVAMLMGLRQGEALGLRWSRVNLDEDDPTIVVDSQLVEARWSCPCKPSCQDPIYKTCKKRVLSTEGLTHEVLQNTFILTPPKTHQGFRQLPIPTVMVPIMKAEWKSNEARKAADPGFNPHDLVWTRASGAPIPKKNDSASWKAILKEAGVEGKDLHEARNTMASNFLEARVDPYITSLYIGHADIKTTQKYQVARPKTMLDAVNKASHRRAGK